MTLRAYGGAVFVERIAQGDQALLQGVDRGLGAVGRDRDTGGGACPLGRRIAGGRRVVINAARIAHQQFVEGGAGVMLGCPNLYEGSLRGPSFRRYSVSRIALFAHSRASLWRIERSGCQ